MKIDLTRLAKEIRMVAWQLENEGAKEIPNPNELKKLRQFMQIGVDRLDDALRDCKQEVGLKA